MSMSPTRKFLLQPRVAACMKCKHFGAGWVCALKGASIRDDLKRPLAKCPDGRWGRLPFVRVRSFAAARRATALYLVEGAVQILVVLLKVCRPDKFSVTRRRLRCKGCEHRKSWLGLFRFCDRCKCLLWAKVRAAAQACPVGKWRPTRGTDCDVIASLPVLGVIGRPSIGAKGCNTCGGKHG